MAESYHVPVLLEPALEGLAIKEGGVYVDVTFGGGGHSRAILERLSSEGRLLGFDQDPDALSNTLKDDRFTLIHQNFKFMKNHLRLEGVTQVDGILADLGVSSHQFDTAERGFSTRYDAELDMRMDQARVLRAKDVINTYSEADLHFLFGRYGEVQNAKTLAKLLCNARAMKPINSVLELKEVIKDIVPRGREHKYFAQLFQALRIEVNDELEALKILLEQSSELLKPGGRLVVISYHSLEDRLVKAYMQKGRFRGEVEKDFYGNEIKPFRMISRKALVASATEIERNNRARSAKLRVAEKI